MFNANLQKGYVSLWVAPEFSFWAFSVGYAVSAECFEEGGIKQIALFGVFLTCIQLYSSSRPENCPETNFKKIECF